MQVKAAPPKRSARRRASLSDPVSFGWASQSVFSTPFPSLAHRSFWAVGVLFRNSNTGMRRILDGWLIARANYMNEKRFVYVLRSHVDPKRYYAGITSDVRRRLETHNSGGSHHTARLRPWHLVVAVEFATERSALLFERYLKTGSGRAFAKRHFI